MGKLCIHKLDMGEVAPFNRIKKKKRPEKYKTSADITLHAEERLNERFDGPRSSIMPDIIGAIKRGNIKDHTLSKSYKIYGRYATYIVAYDLGIKTVLYNRGLGPVDGIIKTVPKRKREEILKKLTVRG